MGSLKIFLSYHKSTPLYKSDVFQPVGVGGFKQEGVISDNTGDNISELNPFYCELTGHYWVLKNYIDSCNDDYIGFAHYRRLPDLKGISDKDNPSIYGMKYSDSLKFFEDLNRDNLYEVCKNYDVILPCTCYMYENTVNPLLREDEPHYSVYEHFKKEHKNACLDYLRTVIQNDYPEFKEALDKCFESEKSHFYNIYIMKRELLKDFLFWQFDVLEKVGVGIKESPDYDSEKYKRMAGFVAETLINVWLNKYNNLKTGYVPIYMIDFETDYIERAKAYHSVGDFENELENLKALSEITSDRFNVLLSIAEVCAISEKSSELKEYLARTEIETKTADDYCSLAQLCAKYDVEAVEKICEYYEKAIAIEKNNKYYASAYLVYTESLHNLERTARAWEYMKSFNLTESEKDRYERFSRIFDKINN